MNQTRRAFLATAARIGTGAVGAALLERAPAADSRPGWQLGCYTRPFDQFDYHVAMDAIAEAGFKYVGLMTTNTKDWVMIRPNTPVEEVRTMKAEAAKRDLEVLSIYGDFSVSGSVEEGARDLRRLIDHCAVCACPNLLLGGTSDAKVYEGYYKAVAECCGYAAGKGVGLSVKPHGGQNATGPQCRKAIELVNRKNFGLWYDPGNIFYYSDGKLDPVEDAATVDGVVVGMSVKDFQPPKEVLVNPGSGKVNFPAVLARLKKGGFVKGPLILECLERGPLDKVKAAARRAREFLEGLTKQE
jgi:sugar phosphate isomerase/epimerase